MANQAAPRPCIGDTVRYYESGSELPCAAIVLQNNMPKGGDAWTVNLLVFSGNGETSVKKDVVYFNEKNGRLIGQAIPTDTIQRAVRNIPEIKCGIEYSIKLQMDAAKKELVKSAEEKNRIDAHILSIECANESANEYAREAKRLVGSLIDAEQTIKQAAAELNEANTTIKEAKRITASRQRIAEHKEMQKEEKEAKAFIGHIVRMKSGGPNMTAMKVIKDKGIYCAYMVGSEMAVLNLPHCALEIVEKQQ